MSNTDRLYLIQRTAGQVVKRFRMVDTSYQFDGTRFGVYGQIQSGSTGLNFPYSAASDGSNIFVCDSKNKRVVKLSYDLLYVDSCDFSALGEPFALFYDEQGLYVVGILNYRQITIAQINTDPFFISKYSTLIGVPHFKIPYAISRGFDSNKLIISGFDFLYEILENDTDFSYTVPITIEGESGSTFRGHLKHSNGFLYLLAQRPNKAKLVKVNRAYRNDGDSKIISKQCTYVFSGLNNTILVYDSSQKRILRFNADLNYLETVFKDAGKEIWKNAEDLSGIFEWDGIVVPPEPFTVQNMENEDYDSWINTVVDSEPTIVNTVNES